MWQISEENSGISGFFSAHGFCQISEENFVHFGFGLG